ncbi:MAG: circularly permuted type 2 ATP-grasp protein [Granulosicoccus sp.]
MPIALSTRNVSNLHDETLAADGSSLPSWQLVMGELNNLSAEEIEYRQLDISRQLRANGIAYSSLSNARYASRPWNLDLAPFVIEPAEWESISRALEQRAVLKQEILRDIYTDQSLLKQRLIPPSMVFAHKGYLRDAVNPDSEPDLPMFSADISRAPSGDWYIADDVCQYPEGIGYTVENRLVLSGTMPKLFRRCRVQRVASYFKQLQQAIVELSESDGRCVMLASGPEHPHYFEYAYLAKYLGYTLVQTGDLTVRDNRVFLRTVSDLQRVSVIIRFIDDTLLDPMAVAQSGANGITGLFQAVRSGGVKVINPLGAGVLDNPALNTCLPELCRRMLGEELLMQGPPTYWLGRADHHAHVVANRDELLFRDIDSLGRLFDPRLMDGDAIATLERNIAAFPERYIAQERLDRSIAPSFHETQRVNQQVTVRCFLTNNGNGYSAMPGGLCLLDTASDGRRPAYDSFKGSKDTWVIAEGPVKPVSLLTSAPLDSQFAVIDGELPSRVGENLFWMGRNAERCEICVRLLRSIFQTLQNDEAGTSDVATDELVSPVMSAILRATTMATGTLPGFVGRGGRKRIQDPQRELLSLLHDPSRFGTLPNALNQLQNSAASARDRVSDELLRVLNRLDDVHNELVDNPTPALAFDNADTLKAINGRLDNTLLSLSAFAGLAHENFTHGDGWRFMMLGRRLERVQHTCVVVNAMLAHNRDDVLLLETLLRLFDSAMTYRSRYRSQIDVRLVLRLLLLDEFNPRSLAFQLKEIQDTIGMLPGRRSLSQADTLSRLAIGGLSRIQLADPQQLIDARRDDRQNLSRLLSVLEKLPGQMADVLNATYFSHVQPGKQLADLRPFVSGEIIQP